ncbi:MAG: hypothetical protein IT276_14795 [Ignavibacteriaceae bacterium]|nr:hypothetical protein [Ignavibacteriaceae bacterium]
MPKGDNLKGKGGVKFGSGQTIKGNGKPKKPRFADLLDLVLDADGKMIFPKEAVSIQKDGSVIVQVPTYQLLALNMAKQALKDKGYMDMLLKVKGEYAPEKHRTVDADDQDIAPVIIFGKSEKDVLKELDKAKR